MLGICPVPENKQGLPRKCIYNSQLVMIYAQMSHSSDYIMNKKVHTGWAKNKQANSTLPAFQECLIFLPRLSAITL